MNLPLYLAKSDSQLSSIRIKLYFLQILFNFEKSFGFPNKFTAKIAFVLLFIDFSINFRLIFKLFLSISTKLSLNPYRSTGKYVVLQLTPGTMILSPFFMNLL